MTTKTTKRSILWAVFFLFLFPGVFYWGDPVHSAVGWIKTYPNHACFSQSWTEWPWGGETPHWCANWKKCGAEFEKGYSCDN